MSKIEYDNFPKFLVSLGIILIALPFLAMLFFLQENSVLLVSRESMSELTEVAQRTLIAKQELSCIITDSIALLSVVCILGGATLLFFGCRMWYVLQKKIEDKQDVELQTAKMHLRKMRPEEEKEKVSREIMEQKQKNTNNENIVLSHSERLKKYFEVEKAVTKKIKWLLSSKYTIMANRRIDTTNYDVIAESKSNDIDYIFEIKYLFTSYSWNAHVWNELPRKMYMRAEIYTRETNRKAHPVLLLVTVENQVARLKQAADNHWETPQMRVSVISENEINNLTVANLIGD